MRIGSTIMNIIRAIMRGELFLGKADRFFLHIIYLFFVVWMTIFVSLKIEQTMLTMEKNKEALESLKIYHAQKTAELAAYDRLSTIEEKLKSKGSRLGMPEKPATYIER